MGKILLRFLPSLRSPSFHYGKNKPTNKISSTRFCPGSILSSSPTSFLHSPTAFQPFQSPCCSSNTRHTLTAEPLTEYSLYVECSATFTLHHSAPIPSTSPTFTKLTPLPSVEECRNGCPLCIHITLQCDCSSSIKKSSLFLYLINLDLPYYLL